MRPLPAPLPALALLFLACGGAPAGAQPSPAAPGDAPGPTLHGRALQEAPGDTGVVRVSGSAEVSVAPDRARVTFAVETQAGSAADASQENAATMQAVLAAIREGGFPGLELETFGYTLSPVYSSETEDGRRVQRIEGYRALNNVGATLSDPDRVGGVVDAAIGAGANRIGGIAFYASETDDARDEALRQAVERATRQARVMAAALGRTLGEPVDVQGGADVPGVRMRSGVAMEMMQARADTPVEAGDQTVSARVSITFTLGPAEPR